jgi:hypothetical protein
MSSSSEIYTQAQQIINEVKLNELRHNLRTQINWLRVSDILESLSIVFTGTCTILSFATGYFDNIILSLCAGFCGVLASTMLIYSKYSYKESQEREKRLTKILNTIKNNSDNFEYIATRSDTIESTV